MQQQPNKMPRQIRAATTTGTTMARLTGCEGEIGWTTKVDVRLIVDFSGE